MDQYVLEAIDITKDFPGVRALDKVKLSIKEKEILGLVGENGAGKSTLLKIFNGLFPAGTYEGEVRINGTLVEFSSPKDAHSKGVGYVPQEINVLDQLSLAENIYIEELKREGDLLISFNKLNKRATELMKTLGMKMDADTKVSYLSTAEKQLLMIARALSRPVPILILDEPTTALTKDETRHLFSILCDIKKKGTSIIFVTHKLEEIMNVTDRVTVFRDGQYISTYKKSEYDAQSIVQDMVGRKISVLYPQRKTKIGNEILRVEDISVDHPKIINKKLIENVSFSLHKGEVLGLAGLMGAGRTETLRAIYGSLELSKGRIFINNKQVQINSEKDAINNGIGFITEDRKHDGLLMITDIMQNISISNLGAILKNHFLNKKLEIKRANHYKKVMSIKAENVESKVVSLSGGNQQKVLLAKALNIEPQIILLDEPTKGIDIGSKTEVYHIINAMVQEGKSVVMVSSELPELLAMSDRLIVMAEGRVLGEIQKPDFSEERVMSMCVK